MTKYTVKYEVVRIRPFCYRVYRETRDYRDHLRTFARLQRAEDCAKGLAEGTWYTQGPIMASFVVPEEEKDDQPSS